MANEAAALPWGLPAGNQNNDPEINVNVPESMKLEIGVAKIEVKWILSSDEENDAASDVTKVSSCLDHFQISKLLCLAFFAFTPKTRS